jgi:hypothetical protein
MTSTLYMLKSKNIKAFWAKLRSRFNSKPIWHIAEGHVIEHAFTHRGRDFFRIKDTFNTHTLRGMAAVEVYDKWNMRMDRDTLQKYVAEIKNLLIVPNGGTLDLPQVVSLLNGMQERLNWVIAPQEYMKDLFCVMYFDKHESPYDYDPAYQIEKKRFLFGGGDAIDPFLSYSRLSELIPLPKLSQSDLETALKVIQQLEIQASRNLYAGNKQGKPKSPSSTAPNLKSTTQKT